MESWREELYHYGILNQKWVVRRYQNRDGSLTPAGKKRYSTSSDDSYDREQKKRMRVRKKAERLASKATRINSKDKSISKYGRAVNVKIVEDKDGRLRLVDKGVGSKYRTTSSGLKQYRREMETSRGRKAKFKANNLVTKYNKSLDRR